MMRVCGVWPVKLDMRRLGCGCLATPWGACTNIPKSTVEPRRREGPSASPHTFIFCRIFGPFNERRQQVTQPSDKSTLRCCGPTIDYSAEFVEPWQRTRWLCVFAKEPAMQPWWSDTKCLDKRLMFKMPAMEYRATTCPRPRPSTI